VARAAPSEDWPRTVAEFEAWHARQPELDDPPVRLVIDDLYAATDLAA
jgi:hypothetical protein